MNNYMVSYDGVTESVESLAELWELVKPRGTFKGVIVRDYDGKRIPKARLHELLVPIVYN